MRPVVFGVGLVSLDYVVNRFSGAPVRASAGGTCGNVLTILAHLGWEAFPVARLDDGPQARLARADMARWGVRLDFTGCPPTQPAPVIIEEIRRGRDGTPGHRFGWMCPRCRARLPRFRPVTLDAVAAVAPSLPGAAVCFLDRVSPAALAIATRAAAEGAVVVFEPQSPGDPLLSAAALRLAHVVKYSDQRLAAVAEAAPLLEVQTLGASGLRYRHRFGPARSEWLHLDAVPATDMADSCGSGDWCTAGFLARAADRGLAGLLQGGAEAAAAALRHGQTLAAWNCGFDGARGGMYAGEPVAEVEVACPACWPGGG